MGNTVRTHYFYFILFATVNHGLQQSKSTIDDFKGTVANSSLTALQCSNYTGVRSSHQK